MPVSSAYSRSETVNSSPVAMGWRPVIWKSRRVRRVLYDGSDPPVLQYNAAALIALWLNVGQCVITALMQLMLRLSIHAIDPSASLPAFGHKAARKLRVMASVISAGDGVYSEPVGETSSQRRAADKRIPARFPEITQDSFLEISGALPTTFCR